LFIKKLTVLELGLFLLFNFILNDKSWRD
jgi:hypothetical protein